MVVRGNCGEETGVGDRYTEQSPDAVDHARRDFTLFVDETIPWILVESLYHCGRLSVHDQSESSGFMIN